MKYFTLTPQQKKDIRDGKTVTLTAKDDGTQYIITPWIIHHALEQIASGAGEIVALPQIVDDGMEEIRIPL